LHLLAVERWSRGRSAIHRRDARAKAGALLVFLVVLSTTNRGLLLLAAALLVLLATATRAAGLPLGKVLLRAGTVLVFTVMVALAAWLAGDPQRAAALLVKSYLSAWAVFLVAATTPIQALLRGLAACGIPHFFLMVVQFLFRYLFVIVNQAGDMKRAAQARGGALGFRDAGAAIAALFARSYTRADEIHRSILARGFRTQFHSLDIPRFGSADTAFLAGVSLTLILIRAAVERWNG
jgi:cobalt/nickel transport system permease protein